MSALVIRLGPVDIRDQDLRSRATHVQRVRLTHAVWSDPGRIVYLSGLVDAEGNEPPAIAIEIEARNLLGLHATLGRLLKEGGYVK